MIQLGVNMLSLEVIVIGIKTDGRKVVRRIVITDMLNLSETIDKRQEFTKDFRK